MIRRFHPVVFSAFFLLACGSAQTAEEPRADGLAETIIVADHSTSKPPAEGTKEARYLAAREASQNEDPTGLADATTTLGALSYEEPINGINYYSAVLYLDGLVRLKRHEEACTKSTDLHRILCLTRDPLDRDVCESFQAVSTACSGLTTEEPVANPSN